MRLIALMCGRNEGWIAGLSIRIVLNFCDEAVVLLHACTDDTGDIVRDAAKDNPGRVHVLIEKSPEWNEMAHRQKMLDEARARSATHCAIQDFDEILSADSLPFIRSEIEALKPGVMLYPRLYNMRNTPTRYHLNGIWSNRVVALAFKDTPQANWTGDTFHHREPHGVSWIHGNSNCRVMHLWGVTERRLIARHALYKLTERMRWPDKAVAAIDAQYNLAIYPRQGDSPWTFAEAQPEWWKGYENLVEKYLDLDCVPWHEQMVRDILAQHPELGRGLDLFGLGNRGNS